MTTLSQRVAAARAAKATAAKPAVEDLDAGAVGQGPTPVQMIEPNIVPCTDSVKALAETYQELEAKAEDEAAKDAQDDADDLGAVRDELDADNETGGISAESLTFAMLATRYHGRRLGIESYVGIPSMESAISDAGRGKVVVSTESLTASLEGVDKPVKEFVKRGASTFYRLVAPLWASVKIAGMGLEGLARKAQNIKPVPGAKIKISAAQIGVGDGPSKNLAADLQKAAAILSFMTKKFSGEASEAYKHNVKITDEILGDLDEVSQFEKGMKDILAKWEDPRKKLGDRAADPIIGNYRLFEDHSLKYKGDNPVAKAFDELANHNYPTLVGFQNQSTDGSASSGEVELPALTPQQISQIALAFKSATRDFGYWREQVEKLAAAGTAVAIAGAPLALMSGLTIPAFAAWVSIYLTKLNRRRGQFNSKPGEATMAEDLRTVYDALVTSNRLRFHTGYDAGRVLRKTIWLFKKVAKLSLKAHAGASVESLGLEDADKTVYDAVDDQGNSTKRLKAMMSWLNDHDCLTVEGKQAIAGEMAQGFELSSKLVSEKGNAALKAHYKTWAEKMSEDEAAAQKYLDESMRTSIEMFDTAKELEGETTNDVSPIEPEQVPGDGNSAPTGEVVPKQKTVEDSALLKQDLDGPADEAAARSDVQEIKRDNEICVDKLGDGTTQGGPGLESMKIKVPYWYKKRS